MSDLYEKCECIGKGSFGEVYKGNEIATGNTVALKLVDLEKADEEIEVIQREIKVMSQISNPHVVQYHSSMMKGSTLWIVMEFMSGGSLKDLLDVVGPFPEDAVATVMKALFKGLDYVHKGRKVHRDIKAANILLSEHGEVKLADFGVAGQMTGTMRQRNTFVGSPFWMAPEVIQESLYDEKADIWSAGITGMELANGLPPYATEHPYRALFLIPQNDPPRLDTAHFSKSFRDFIALCLKKNPAERPSAEQLLTHSFLRKARTSSIKELLRKKEYQSEEDSGKVIIGGDSLPGSINAPIQSPNGSQGKMGSARSDANPGLWEFDFGSISESQIDKNEISEEIVDGSATPDEEPRRQDLNNTEAEKKHEGCEENSQQEPVEDGMAAVRSQVLSEVILPVISKIRADVDTCGIHNHNLMASLGALEVCFVDAETARPGISNTLLESLFTEALMSNSTQIRATLVRALQKRDPSDGR